jgi:hypothetical protein
MRAVLAIFAAAVLTAAPAFAEDKDAEGLHLGVGLGDFSTGIDDISDVDEANLDFDSDKSVERFFAGWRFNRVVALQLATAAATPFSAPGSESRSPSI